MEFAKALAGSTHERWLRYAIGALVAALMLLAFPPFHVRSLNAPPASPPNAPTAFDPSAVAQRWWEQDLPAARPRAVDVAVLAAALSADANAADRFGRRTGLGGKYFYFVRGEGRVSSVDAAGVHLEIGVPGAEVLLKTGPVFGNALRDAPGLFELDAHSSFEGNAFSTELNRIAETRVQPVLLERAAAGVRLQFMACGEADLRDSRIVLKLIAISADKSS